MNFENMPPIETSRLLLRPPVDMDFEPFAIAQANEEFKKYTGGILSREKAFEEFVLWQNFWQIKEYGFFSIIDKSTGLWVGRTGPTMRADFNFPEFGWSLIPQFQRKGLAKEAVNAVLNWAITELKWHEAYFCIGRENKNSQNLAIKIGAYKAYQEKLPEVLQSQGVEVWYKSLQK